jgi:hypothetical protein
MRFMVIVSGPDDAGPPTSEELAAMGRYNEQLLKAGVMRYGEGLHPTRKGAKVTFSGSKRGVIDGPYAEAKEVIGGFWILEVEDKAEVIEWVKKIPFESGSVDIRQIAEVEDFKLDDVSRDALEKEKVWKEQLRDQ